MNDKGKVILIGAEDEENLAIRYLGAVLTHAGHQVKLIPCSRYEDIPPAINKFKNFYPDLVGVSMAFQSRANLFFELIQQIKKIRPEVHVTVGGHFPSFEYNDILKKHPVNSVIRFEGEKPILMLIEALLHEKNLDNIPNLVYLDQKGNIRENFFLKYFPDMETIPFPLRNKKPQLRLGEKFATLITSRGCFYSKCLYCCIGAFHQEKTGPKYVLRTPKSVAKEMRILYHRKKVRLFQFHDDNFLLPESSSSLARISSLKTALQDEKVDIDDLAIIIKTRPDSINKDVISALLELGVVGVFLGVENASNSGLKALSRKTTLQEINAAVKVLEKFEVAVTYNLLIFHPRATLDQINENIHFINNNLDKSFDFGRAEIVAGSPLEKLVKRKGLLRGEWPQWDYRIEDPAVEKMFRINALTFHGSNSPYTELSHGLIALSYRAELIRRFYTGKKAEGLGVETKELIQKSNEFTLEKLLQIYKLTAQSQIEEKLRNLKEEMDVFYGHLIQKTENLSDRMLRFQLMERKFREQDLENYFQKSKVMDRIFRI